MLKIITSWIDLFFPSFCVGCNQQISFFDNGLCPKCFSSLKNYLNPQLAEKNNLQNLDREIFYQKHFILGDYLGNIKKVLQAYKFKEKKRLMWPLADLILGKLNFKDLEIDAISYVPMSKKKEINRGYNQSHLLAKKMAVKLKLPLLSLLKEKKKSKIQKKLSTFDRFINVINRYQLTNSQKVLGKKILLVDDVFTTGATANECSRILLSAGAKEVNLFTVARVNF